MLLKEHISSRVLTLARYIVENESTVRQAASIFGISKSTVHKDVTERLLHIDAPLFLSVKKTLEQNKSERHIRGGEATRLKYALLHKNA